MDPNKALKSLRGIRDAWERSQADHDDLDYAMELFVGLDEWLSKGGFLPKAWAGEDRLIVDGVEQDVVYIEDKTYGMTYAEYVVNVPHDDGCDCAVCGSYDMRSSSDDDDDEYLVHNGGDDE